MDRQEIDDELSTTGAQELLASTSAAHLAYVGTDETPRVIPVGFFWTGDQVVISTATTSPKVTALSTHPDVALAIDAGDTPERARALSIRGRASVEIVDGVVEEYLAAARRTMDADAAAEFEQMVRLEPGEPVSHYNLGVLDKLAGSLRADEIRALAEERAAGATG